MRGRFVTLEGIEGTGKSSNLGYIAGRVREHGQRVLETREPGGTQLGEAIRGLLLDGDHMGAMAELLLMFAARADHLERCIRPALARGEWVICDRFTDASYAYQGAGRGLGRSAVAALERLVHPGLQPDLTVLLDAAPEALQSRRQQRAVHDRFEAEDLAFFREVRAAYLARAMDEGARIRVVDAARSLDAVRADIDTILDDFIKNNV